MVSSSEKSQLVKEPGHDIYTDIPLSSNPNFPSLHFPFSAFMKGILLCYDIAICNLSSAAFRFLTCFELLNQWLRAKLDIPEFRMLHNIWLANRSICADEATIPSIASTLTSVPLLQVFVDEPSRHDGFSSMTLLRSKGTTYPPFVIHHLVDRVALSSDANGLRNTDYARALLEVAIAPADFKKNLYFSKRCHDAILQKRGEVKDYGEIFEVIREELRLKKQANVETNQALTVLKEKLESVLTSEQNAWAKEQETLLKKVDDLRYEVGHKDDKHIEDLQLLIDRYYYEEYAL
ncbi:S2-RNase [Pyrus ussuriensis x Pyrus communis]|uniref:S2-RNase n=1 Tax=Pyrus ussuriensis x Pyrus communis TaxID=2448454 RepID=A0A5N5HDD5_9ROSA|nr:S2-RNase [Pyrus ussuriensis x Pyrus communis]